MASLNAWLPSSLPGLQRAALLTAGWDGVAQRCRQRVTLFAGLGFSSIVDPDC